MSFPYVLDLAFGTEHGYADNVVSTPKLETKEKESSNNSTEEQTTTTTTTTP